MKKYRWNKETFKQNILIPVAVLIALMALMISPEWLV